MLQLLTIVVLILPTGQANHDSTPLALELMATRLPFDGLHSASAVWDGVRYGYLFGGTNNTGPTGVLDSVLRYEPATGALQQMNARLPTGRAGTSAAWAGGYAYVFGGARLQEDRGGDHGHVSSVLLDDVIRYDPRTDTVQVMKARLPSARWGTSAISDGASVFVFGGHDGAYLDEILRYEPRSDSLTTSPATFTVPIFQSSAVWTGEYAYIWGEGGTGYWPNRVYQYDPQSDNLSMTEAKTPSPRSEASSVWDGRQAYLFGGRLKHPVEEILKFDPATQLVVTLGEAAPLGDLRPGRAGTAAIWTGTHAFIFGGEQFAQDAVSDEILRFHPGAERPTTGTTTDADEGIDSPKASPDLQAVAPFSLIVATCILAARRRDSR